MNTKTSTDSLEKREKKKRFSTKKIAIILRLTHK